MLPKDLIAFIAIAADIAIEAKEVSLSVKPTVLVVTMSTASEYLSSDFSLCPVAAAASYAASPYFLALSAVWSTA
jgi:hypothetical protein